jgi:hypothetical protein
MQIEMMVKGAAVNVRFCSRGSLGSAAYDFTTGDGGGVMYVYASTIKRFACSSAPLTFAQLQDAEARAQKQEKEESTSLAAAQASGALDQEIWERINRNPRDTMTTDHRKYLGLPWHRGSGVIQYAQAKAILGAKPSSPHME